VREPDSGPLVRVLASGATPPPGPEPPWPWPGVPQPVSRAATAMIPAASIAVDGPAGRNTYRMPISPIQLATRRQEGVASPVSGLSPWTLTHVQRFQPPRNAISQADFVLQGFLRAELAGQRAGSVGVQERDASGSEVGGGKGVPA
jgi:hypothetical protein